MSFFLHFLEFFCFFLNVSLSFSLFGRPVVLFHSLVCMVIVSLSSRPREEANMDIKASEKEDKKK